MRRIVAILFVLFGVVAAEAQTDTTIICTVPVPAAIHNLGRSRPKLSQAVASNINHLLIRYCRQSSEFPSVIDEGSVVQLNDKCWQSSGYLNGERVYWLGCSALEASE
jgi:hypothetical protein